MDCAPSSEERKRGHRRKGSGQPSASVIDASLLHWLLTLEEDSLLLYATLHSGSAASVQGNDAKDDASLK